MSAFSANTLLHSLPAVQSVGTNCLLKGSVKLGPEAIPLSDLKHVPPGISTLILIRKTDVLSAHLKNAMTSKLTLPAVSITTPSGKSVNLSGAQITNIKTIPPDDWTSGGSSATDNWTAMLTKQQSAETEEISFTFKTIAVEYKGTGATDSWDTRS